MASIEINANDYSLGTNGFGMSEAGFDVIEASIEQLGIGETISVRAGLEIFEVARNVDGYVWRGLNGHHVGFPSRDRSGAVLKSFAEERVQTARHMIRRVGPWADHLLSR